MTEHYVDVHSNLDRSVRVAVPLRRTLAHWRRYRRTRVVFCLVVVLLCTLVLVSAKVPTATATAQPPPGGLVPSAANFGWTEGAFSVSDDGAAEYSLPLWVPKGRGDVQPDLALSYHSRGGNGLVGVGWSVRGLSSIGPCPRTVAQDNRLDAVTFTGEDVYCLDGSRLRPVAPHTGAEREYRTERDMFARIVSYGPPGAVPTSFRVWAKDGKVLTFGQQDGSRLRAFQLVAGPSVESPSLVRGSTSRATAAWALDRVEDRNGNSMTITYAAVEGGQGSLWYSQMVPQAITYGPNRSVQFSYETRPDEIDGFGGGVHTRTGVRLSRISMFAGPGGGPSELLREYRLSYQATSVTGRSMLNRVTECDHNGACLRPLEFGWSLGSNGFDVIDTNVTDVGTSQNSGYRLFPADVDGDGNDDLVYPDGANNWRIRRNTGNATFAAAQSAGIPRGGPGLEYQSGLRPVDFDVDGRMDFMAEVYLSALPLPKSEYALYRSNGTSYAGYTPDIDQGHISEIEKDLPYFLDLDGNGMPDYVTPRSVRPASQRFHYRLNTGSGYAPMVSTPIVTDRGPTARIHAVDVDGDGRTSLVLGNSTLHRYDVFGVNGAGSASIGGVNLPYPANMDPRDLHFADVNGDGLADAIYPLSGLRTQLNSGRGFSHLIAGPSQYLSPAYHPNADPGVRIADFTNDGRDDVMLLLPGTPRGDQDYERGIQLYTWRDGGFVRVSVNQPAGKTNLCGTAICGMSATQTLDVNGDGLLDIVQVRDGGAGPDHLRVLKRRGTIPDQLISVGVGSVGPRVEVEYTTLRDAAQQGTCAYPQRCPADGGSIVRNHRLANGEPGGWNLFSHQYKGARYDLSGRGWLGFTEHTVLDWQAGSTTVTEFDNVTRDAGQTTLYPFAQLPKRTTFTVIDQAQGREHRRTVENQYVLRRLPIFGTYTVELRRVTNTEQERAVGAGTWQTLRTQTIDREYDTFGSETTVSSGMAGGRRVSQRTDYQNDQVNWLIGRPTRMLSTGCTPADICATRESTFGYDAEGNLAETVVEPGRPELRLRTAFTRTAAGNVSRIAKSDSAGSVRAERFGYDGDGLHVTETTNALDRRTRITVHSGLGVALSMTDPNNVTVTMRHDWFGRLRETNHADGSFEHIQHLLLFGSQVIVTSEAGGGGTIAELDMLGREKTKGVKAFGSSAYASIHTGYDRLGRVATVSRPTLDTQRHNTTYAYDRLGRQISQTEPDGATVRHQYLGRETHTYDANGTHSYTVATVDRDVATRFEDDPRSTGWLQTRFEYGPFGELTKTVAADGTSQAMQYDVLGRRIQHSDPSTGVTASGYNAFGELTSEIDGAGRQTQFEHDPLGRRTRTTSPDGVATNTWDTAPNGIGLLASARSADGAVTQYTYDQLARNLTTTWNVEGTAYAMTAAYDDIGRPAGLTYPKLPGVTERLSIAYSYNATGYLSQVRDSANGLVYWQVDARNAAGQLERERFGNGVVGTREYQPQTGLLQKMLTTGPGTTGVIDSIAYAHDANRNVLDRYDIPNARRESYTYDTLNRLATWKFRVGGEVSTTYTYTSLGNLTNETTAGRPDRDVVYRYGEGGAPPHAVTSRNAGRYTYDGVGRQLTGPERTVQYNRVGLPKVLTWGQGQRTEFRYDADDARVLKRDSAQTTVSVPGLFERRTSHPGGDPPPDYVQVRNIHHIVVDGRTVAQVIRIQAVAGGPVTATEVSYLHTDLQGSIVQVTGAAGQVKEELFYDPFGRRTDAAYEPLPDNRRGGPRLGYTGHEHDDELGLIDMKGRVFDPKLRRFLTPDPTLQDPLSSQSHNRYSYVWNNPTTRTDPTGFQTVCNDEAAPAGCESPSPEPAMDWLDRTFQFFGSGGSGGGQSQPAAGNSDDSGADIAKSQPVDVAGSGPSDGERTAQETDGANQVGSKTPPGTTSIDTVLATAGAWLATAVANSVSQREGADVSPTAAAAGGVPAATGFLTKLGNSIKKSVLGRVVATWLDAKDGPIIYPNGTTERITRTEAIKRNTRLSAEPSGSPGNGPKSPVKVRGSFLGAFSGVSAVVEIILTHRAAKQNGRGFFEQLRHDGDNTEFMFPGVPNPGYSPDI